MESGDLIRGQALFGVRPYPLECYISKGARKDLLMMARPDPKGEKKRYIW